MYQWDYLKDVLCTINVAYGSDGCFVCLGKSTGSSDVHTQGVVATIELKMER